MFSYLNKAIPHIIPGIHAKKTYFISPYLTLFLKFSFRPSLWFSHSILRFSIPLLFLSFHCYQPKNWNKRMLHEPLPLARSHIVSFWFQERERERVSKRERMKKNEKKNDGEKYNKKKRKHFFFTPSLLSLSLSFHSHSLARTPRNSSKALEE